MRLNPAMLPPRIKTLRVSTAYLPPVEYVARMAQSACICIEQWENYQKQTYRNRCILAAAGGLLPLTIPVEKPTSGSCALREVRLSDHGNWRHLHWNGLVSAYRSSPFFEYYADDFAPFYEKKWKFLLDYNEELLRLICAHMGFTPEIQRSERFIPLPKATSPEATACKEDEKENQEIADFRERIHPKRTPDASFKPVPYYQVFATQQGFQPNVSAIDLLFNMGPESILVLRDSLPSLPNNQTPATSLLQPV